MALTNSERDVFLLKLRVSNYPSGGEETKIEKVLEWIKEFFDGGDTQLNLDSKGGVIGKGAAGVINDQRNSIYISDLDIDEQRKLATILFNRGDPEISVSSFVNMTTKEIRTPDKKSEEVVGHSAHLVLDFNESNMIGEYFRCYFERVPNISRTIVQNYFNKKLEEKSDQLSLNYYSKGSKKDVRYSPKIKLEGMLSKSIENDLEHSRLSMIEFSKAEKSFQGINIADRVDQGRHIIQVRVQPEKQRAGIVGWINERMKEATTEGFTEMKLHIKDLPGGHNATPRFKTEGASPAELLFMKIETISDFSTELPTCCKQIIPEVREKMLALGD